MVNVELIKEPQVRSHSYNNIKRPMLTSISPLKASHLLQGVQLEQQVSQARVIGLVPRVSVQQVVGEVVRETLVENDVCVLDFARCGL